MYTQMHDPKIRVGDTHRKVPTLLFLLVSWTGTFPSQPQHFPHCKPSHKRAPRFIHSEVHMPDWLLESSISEYCIQQLKGNMPILNRSFNQGIAFLQWINRHLLRSEIGFLGFSDGSATAWNWTIIADNALKRFHSQPLSKVYCKSRSSETEAYKTSKNWRTSPLSRLLWMRSKQLFFNWSSTGQATVQ